MTLYRKLPVIIEAVQLTWETWDEVCDFVGPFPEGMRGVYLDENDNPVDEFPGVGARLGLLIPTLEGIMLAKQEDYIIRGVEGEFYPCKPGIFVKTYEPMETDEVDRLVELAESDLVQDMDSDPVEPDMEIGFYEETGFVHEVSLGEFSD